MHEHRIILSSSYSTGRRICLHSADPRTDSFSGLVKAVGGAYDGKEVPFSIHSIKTDSADWESVVRSDPYFDDVKVLGSADEFIQLLQKDRFLTGLDVAKYILSKDACTHTRLEKLTYMCYADYICDFGQKLFEDKIYAFDHGPVVDSVYKIFSGYSRLYPGSPIIPIEQDMDCGRQDKMPIKSRIMFSEDGPRKIGSIVRSLEKYTRFTTEELIELSHKGDTPWKAAYVKSEFYSEMTDSDIIRLHPNETGV